MNDKLINFVKKWEGGLSRDKADTASSYPCPTPFAGKTGWHTNKGITYTAWTKYFGTQNDDRFFEMNNEDWALIAMSGYWKAMKCDEVIEPINFILFSWAWGSGSSGATKLLQSIVGTKKDGIIGKQTIGALNVFIGTYGKKGAFDKLCDERLEAFKKMKTWNIHGKGWSNRLTDFRKTFRP